MFQCSECHREIGLMADEKGRPVDYFCPRRQTVSTTKQEPVARRTPKLTPQQRADVDRIK